MTVLLPSTAEKDLAKFALALQQLAAGRSNATGTVTLATGAASTVVSAVNCSPQSAVFLFPKTADGAPSAAPTFTVTKQIFTASGTYTPSAGMAYCVVECAGPGGGGGAAVGAVGSLRTGAGGSAGGYSRSVFSAATIGASKAVVVGTHGSGGAAGTNNGTDGSAATTFGATLCTANPGKGGRYSDGTQIPNPPAVAAAGTGDLAIAGNPGGAGQLVSSAQFSYAGAGGAGPFGGGAPQTAIAAATATAGAAGTGYGSGGAGASAYNVAANAAGGNGADGVVFITEYCFSAAAAGAATFVSSVGKQTFTISHDNNAIADRTFFYVCLG